MRRGFYFRLAAEGISKNRKFYFPYILTCICMVMMFYIVAYLAMSADFSGVFGGDMLQSMLGFGVFVIGIFSLIFLYYTNSFLIRRRQKEFGLYNILGMGKRNLVKILLWENILTAVVSIAAGLAFGILFSKLAEMAAVKILGGKTGFDMHVAAKPVIWTVVLFLAITLLIMLRMVVSIFRLRPVEMLRSENTGEKPPKANWLLAILGAALLGAAYYLAVAVLDPMAAMVLFFLAVVMVILATYFLFIAGSVALCRLLQKNKRYYYKTKHFISLSSMTYRMKRNGAGLASICILSTMVLVTVSSTTCLFAQSEDAVSKRYPKDLSVQISFADQTALSDEDTEPYISAVEEVLDEHGETAENLEDFRMYSLTVYQFGAEFLIDLNNGEQSGETDLDTGEMRGAYVIPLEDYNRLSGTETELADDEALIYPYKMEYEYDTVNFEGFDTWKAEKLEKEPFRIGEADANAMGCLFVVVKDVSVLEQMCRIKNDSLEGEGVSSIQRCYSFDMGCGDEEQSEIYDEIRDRFMSLSEGDDSGNYVYWHAESKAASRAEYVALFGGLFFLGILLGAVFLFGTVLIMYYKQISEGYEDQDRFDILMKVGMSRKEVKQSINSQVLTVFFLPLIAAGVHLAFAYPLISRILNLISAGTDEKLFLFVTACCYLVFAIFYVVLYWVTSKSYYGIVSAKEKAR